MWGVFPGAMAWNVHPNLNLSAHRQHVRPLPLDRHPTCLCLGNVKLSLFMGGPRFEVHFPPATHLWNPVLANYPISINKIAATNAIWFLLTFLQYTVQSTSLNSGRYTTVQ